MKNEMKKHILFVVLCMATLSLSAQDYQHSIGGSIGSLYGVSYKGFIFGVEHLGLQTDLDVRLESTAAGTTLNGFYFTEESNIYTFEFNPNLLYQNIIADFDEGHIDWYAGGGFSIGLAHDLYSYTYGVEDTDTPVYGKFGLNALLGVEVALAAPVNIAIDFRPGYGIAFNDNYHFSFFDWALALSVRYRF